MDPPTQPRPRPRNRAALTTSSHRRNYRRMVRALHGRNVIMFSAALNCIDAFLIFFLVWIEFSLATFRSVPLSNRHKIRFA